MNTQELGNGKTIFCFVHKREKATHICADLYCHHNPIICALCMSEAKYRGAHTSHDSAVKSVPQALETLSGLVRSQTKSVESLYERTIGSREHEPLRNLFDKGNFLLQELQSRIETLKAQMDSEMELLFKEFQKQMMLEKQDCSRRLEEYKRTLISNIEVVRKQCFEVLSFQGALKYYSNPNNLLIKLANSTERKSIEWLLAQKKVLLRMNSVLDNSYFSTQLLSLLGRAGKMNLTGLPFWRSDRKDVETEKDIKGWIKEYTTVWIDIPELNQFEPKTDYPANKTVPNYYQVVT